MTLRSSSLTATLMLVLAACTSGGAGATTSEAPTTTVASTTTTVPAPEAIQLSYALEPGTTLTYEVDLDQKIDLTSEGEGSAGGQEDVPGSMSITMKGTTTFTHTVSDGPEPGTYEVRIQGDFSELTVEGTVDGEPVDSTANTPEVAEIPPIDMTVVVDEQGNPISGGDAMGDLFGGETGGLGGLGGLAGLENLAPGSDLGRLVGPPLPDEPVAVGETWSETIEVPMGMGMEGESITTVTNSEVTATETIEGREVLVIETEMITSMIEFDLAEFLIGFFTAFLPDDATEEELAEIEALKEELRFMFTIDETNGNMTTWFDPEAGLARQAAFETATHMVMDINMPDETTGQMAAFELDMSIDQKATYRLVDSSET